MGPAKPHLVAIHLDGGLGDDLFMAKFVLQGHLEPALVVKGLEPIPFA